MFTNICNISKGTPSVYENAKQMNMQNLITGAQFKPHQKGSDRARGSYSWRGIKHHPFNRLTVTFLYGFDI